MDLTKADALASLKPNSEWTWDWDAENPTVREYDKLVWLDSDTKPTEAEIDAELIKINNAEPMRRLREERDRLLVETDCVYKLLGFILDTINKPPMITFPMLC